MALPAPLGEMSRADALGDASLGHAGLVFGGGEAADTTSETTAVGHFGKSPNSPCAVNVRNPALSPGRARCNNRLRMSLEAWMPQTNLEYSQTRGYGN